MDIGDGNADASSTVVLFKSAGKQTIKVSFLEGLPDDGYAAAGDLGPLEFTKVESYSGEGFSPCTSVTAPTVSSENDAVAIYPNPNNGSFSVSLDGEASAELVLSSYTGQVVYSSVVFADSEINTGLKAGNYIATIKTANSVYVTKIAIK